MDKSVKFLWGGAAVAMAGVMAASVLGALWPAAAFLLAALMMFAAAVTHGRTCEQRRIEAEEVVAVAAAEAERKVAQARLEAEEAKQRCADDISRFHSKISHSLRIPISVIIGYAELLRDGFATEKEVQREYIQKICAKSAYINEILAQILLEMRSETGMAPLFKRPVRLTGLLRRAAADMEAVASRRGIPINVVAEPGEIIVQGDATGLTKVFYNILENSLKHMGGRGAVSITVSMLSADEALVVFKDDGTGMDSTELEHIFELNYQGSNRISGDGLGLFIVKTEINAHGGRVSAKSEPGRGMGVYITLPAARANDADDDS